MMMSIVEGYEEFRYVSEENEWVVDEGVGGC